MDKIDNVATEVLARRSRNQKSRAKTARESPGRTWRAETQRGKDAEGKEVEVNVTTQWRRFDVKRFAIRGYGIGERKTCRKNKKIQDCSTDYKRDIEYRI